MHAAHLLSDRFPDGQLYLDLHGHTQGMSPRDPADALAALLASLGVPPGEIPADPDARAAAYRARLAGTRTLILLDNAAAESQVRPLIPGQAGCLVLITSRKRLKALDQARAVALDVLPEADAVALLRALVEVEPARAPAEDPGWQQIAALCGGLPLALRIAAALIRHRPAWTLAHLADKLRSGPLDLGPFTDGERDLSAVFDLSYQTLADDQRDLLRRLGLVPGPDTDAYAIAALLDVHPSRAEQLLQDLVDHHLLTEPAAGRYRMHDLVRAYAHGRARALDPEPERALALGRLLHYYAHTAQTVSQAITRFPRPEPGGPAPAHVPDLRDPDTARAWLRAEQPNLDAAFTYAHTHGLDDDTVALAAGLADVLHTDGFWTRALDVHHIAAQTADRLGRPGAHATALTDLGRVRSLVGDNQGADDVLSLALDICRTVGSRSGEAHVLTDLGRVRFQTGDFPEACDSLSRALEIYREIGQSTGEAQADTLTELGCVRTHMGDFSGADEVLNQALKIYRDVGGRAGEADVLLELGRVRLHIGGFASSDETLTRALEIYREVRGRSGEADALKELGRVRLYVGDFVRAEEAMTRALEIYCEIRSRSGEAYTLTELGRVWSQIGDDPRSDDALSRALELYRELGDRTGEAYALTEWGRVRQRIGDLGGAGDAHARALKIYRENGGRNCEGVALTEWGRVRHEIGDLPGALDAYAEALEIFREAGAQGNVGWELNYYAAAIAASGDRPQALALYRQALAINRELSKPDDEAISLEGIADHYLATGDALEGTAHLRQALAIYQRLGMNDDAGRVQLRLAGLDAPDGACHFDQAEDK
ncbi:hypothetical protein GCM10009839_08230 [Catenulispora yoronensis]|uniref:Winged helix-turn-helix domain-containing protein n=1 Tax=Catenulispora yoronensis TaxID=450799 RepID=A0ABP5F6N4_9ACTN